MSEFRPADRAFWTDEERRRRDPKVAEYGRPAGTLARENPNPPIAPRRNPNPTMFTTQHHKMGTGSPISGEQFHG